MTRHAPSDAFYHNNDRTSGGSGTFGNSTSGSKAASRRFHKIDNDGHLMHRTRKGAKLGAADTDVVWVNAHGAPFSPKWLRGRKFEECAWSLARLAHPSLRSAGRTFRENARLGVDTEWEVKDVHPLASNAALNVAFTRLAKSARRAYGVRWADHVSVKVLTNLAGGLPYAKKILRHAHAAGFTTIILPRGDAAHGVIDEDYIDYNRGGRV